MEIIRAHNLSKNYVFYKKEEGLKGSLKGLFHREKSTNEAVKEVNFSVNSGELIGFIGPNGAGKTTVLKMLSGILYPSGGELSVLGHIPSKRKNDFLRQIAIVMGQKNQLWWDLPAQDTFRFNKKLYSIPNQEYDQRLKELTDMLGVAQLLPVQVRKLSLGERMKMELIASLLHHPKLLLLDEPTIGLDIQSQKAIRSFVKEYNQQRGNTILLTSHYMKDVQELCNRIIIINKGLLVFDGLQKNLLHTYGKSKNIKISFDQPPAPEQLAQYGEVIDQEEFHATLRVPTGETAELTARLLHAFDINDISIDDISLEDAVEHIF